MDAICQVEESWVAEVKNVNKIALVLEGLTEAGACESACAVVRTINSGKKTL